MRSHIFQISRPRSSVEVTGSMSRLKIKREGHNVNVKVIDRVSSLMGSMSMSQIEFQGHGVNVKVIDQVSR